MTPPIASDVVEERAGRLKDAIGRGSSVKLRISSKKLVFLPSTPLEWVIGIDGALAGSRTLHRSAL